MASSQPSQPPHLCGSSDCRVKNHNIRFKIEARLRMSDYEDLEWEDAEGDDWDCLLQGDDDLIEESNGAIRIEIPVEGRCIV